MVAHSAQRSRIVMRKPVGLFSLTAATIIAAWWWLGAAVPMPPSPLDPGEKLYCVSYAPFRGGQSPLDLSTKISPAQIDADLTQLAKVTDCVRTYSVDFGLDQVPEIAQRHGLKVLLGIWVSSHTDRTQYQISTGVALANRFPDTIRAVIVGNEALLRGEVSPETLGDIIRDVKARVKVPVTYADVWEFWLRYRELASAVDFITIHILPYWEDDPVAASAAADHVDAIRRRVAEKFPGREIVIGEVGWPSEGRMREGALPSPANQARVIADVLTRGKQAKTSASTSSRRSISPGSGGSKGPSAAIGACSTTPRGRGNLSGARRSPIIRIGRGRPPAASCWRRSSSGRRCAVAGATNSVTSSGLRSR